MKMFQSIMRRTGVASFGEHLGTLGSTWEQEHLGSTWGAGALTQMTTKGTLCSLKDDFRTSKHILGKTFCKHFSSLFSPNRVVGSMKCAYKMPYLTQICFNVRKSSFGRHRMTVP
jgi:hypothetical protein